MTLFLIAIFLADPPTDHPIAAKVACVIAFGFDLSVVRHAYAEISSRLEQISSFILNADDDND